MLQPHAMREGGRGGCRPHVSVGENQKRGETIARRERREERERVIIRILGK